MGPSGNTWEDSVQVCKWLEEAGVDAIHVSVGSFFPHPRNPAGIDLPAEELAKTYDSDDFRRRPGLQKLPALPKSSRARASTVGRCRRRGRKTSKAPTFLMLVA